jgi:hypothetical protein
LGHVSPYVILEDLNPVTPKNSEERLASKCGQGTDPLISARVITLQ